MKLPAPAGITSIEQSLLINNKQVAVLLDPPSPGAEQATVYVWNPKAAKSTPCRLQGQTPRIRGIGTWIVGEASSRANGRISPGQAERKKPRLKTAGKQRPDVDSALSGMDQYYPGILFAVDTTTGKVITWQTGQGDSEVLLVRGDNVTYRVNDRLYSARIQDTTLGTPQLLAQDDAIPDMHWAFSPGSRSLHGGPRP
jgi:hypothetical protein